MLKIVEVDFNNRQHTEALLHLISQFAESEFGRQARLISIESDRIISGLKDFPLKEIFLAEKDNEFIGVAICFWEFSIFSGKKMLRIHDVYVPLAFRRIGVGNQLIERCIQRARENDCSFVNIEVDLKNHPAITLYERKGFIDWISPTKYLELKL